MADRAEEAGFDIAAEMPDESRLVTEDDAPLDSVYQEKQQRLLTGPLHDSWPGPPDGEGGHRPFVAMANVGLFHLEEPAIVPDMLLGLDVELPPDPAPKKARSYFLWRYGKPPEVVVEFVSNREGGELDRKKDIYERMRVVWYVVFDPLACLGDVALRCFEHRAGEYVERLDARFDKLGLALVEWAGRFEDMDARWLRWATLDGQLVPTGRERAERERERAERERERAERLAARLRELGVDPEEV